MIYTIGYLGRSVEGLRRIVGTGILLDIRIKPASRRPGFSERRLSEMFGDLYVWLYEFGNEGAGDDIRLYDPEPGIAIVKGIVATTDADIFIMCACRDYNTCHRRTVAQLLGQHGLTVREYEDG